MEDLWNACAHSQGLVISYGLEFKVDLRTFGGQGFKVMNELYGLIRDEHIRDQVLRDNALRVFSWWAPKPAQKTYGKIIACSICGTESEDVSKWFSKDGLYFYTPGCFKKYLNSKKV